jgi:transcriptional regulator with XRE-family HTH domain
MGRKDDADYTIRLGARLRALRRQQHLSLQDVEAASDQEFRASVLGAYGRGERAISVPRLQRLARCYRVPVDQMVPVDDEADIPPTGGDEHSVGRVAPTRGPAEYRLPVSIDLGAVEQLGGPEGELLARYLRTIVVQRGDYAVRTLSIRRDDLTAVACIFRCRLPDVPARLTRAGVCHVP